MQLKNIILTAATLLVIGSTELKASGEIRQVPFTDVKVKDMFWKQRLDVMRNTTIRYAFQKCTDAGQLRNFEYAGKIVSGEKKVGELTFQSGNPYDDAEVYKVLEGASYLLTVEKDTELEAYCDNVVDLICSAQEPDGYLQTNFTIHNPLHSWYGGEKWKMDWNLSHETFNVGELIEAGIAYYQATGKDKLLQCAIKAADNMLSVFNDKGIKMAPGHAVVEMALVRLYELTRNERYLQGCKFFLDCRGIRKFDPNSYDQRVNGKYWQDHLPAIQQRTAEGHAVRALYFYSGMCDWVRYSGDQDYETAITSIWDNIAGKKFYITGGFGARDNNEAFGEDYELPNATAYCETCASVAGSMFNLRMFRLHGEGRYVDMLERALYNTVLDGYGIAGKTFYYPNRLECSTHGSPRSEWFGTSCCPTNLCRLIPSVPGYVYATDDDALYWNLFVASEAQATVGGSKFAFSVTGQYPYRGVMKMTLGAFETKGDPFAIKVRMPGWATGQPAHSDLYTYINPSQTAVTIKVNGQTATYETRDGYAILQGDWKEGDTVELTLPMDVHQVKANDNLLVDNGLRAYERGPIVYCAEGVDNSGSLDGLFITDGAKLTPATGSSDLTSLFKGGLMQVRAAGYASKEVNGEMQTPSRTIKLIPYFAHAHRKATDMKVWIPTEAKSLDAPLQFIDEVKTCDDKNEREHNLQGEGMRTGSDLGWRDSYGGWISYEMKVDPKRPADLVLRLWGSDGGNRRFNIYCDDVLFSYDHVDNFLPNQYYYMHHPIPFDLTKGKEKVTIKMVSASDNDMVGGLYGVYTAISANVPEGTIPVDYLWTNEKRSMTAHKYSSNSGSGDFRGRKWYDGYGQEGQSWTMKVNKTNRNYLMILFWGGETDARNFDVYCDDVLAGKVSLLQNDPGRFFFVCFPIPEEGTSGKESVRIHLTSPTGTKTGGFFMSYMMSTDETEDNIGQVTPSVLPGSVFNLQGLQLPSATAGINIVSTQDGKFRKELTR